MQQTFDRKIFTLPLLAKDVAFLCYKLPVIIKALRNGNVGTALREKVMTVVTAVNGCTYCAYYHAKHSLESGMSEQEVRNMLNLQFNTNAAEHDAVALLYAQNYAETNRHPDNDLTSKLISSYGAETAGHIQLMIRIVFFGNLGGNTFDAFLSRLKGNKAPNSNILFELFFFVVSAPFVLPLMSSTHKFLKSKLATVG